MPLNERQKQQGVAEFMRMREGAKAWLKRQCRAAYNKAQGDFRVGHGYNNIYRCFSPYLAVETAKHYDQGWQDAGGELPSEVNS